MRERQDKKQQPAPETSTEPASKRKLENSKRASPETDDDDERHICRGTD